MLKRILTNTFLFLFIVMTGAATLSASEQSQSLTEMEKLLIGAWSLDGEACKEANAGDPEALEEVKAILQDDDAQLPMSFEENGRVLIPQEEEPFSYILVQGVSGQTFLVIAEPGEYDSEIRLLNATMKGTGWLHLSMLSFSENGIPEQEGPTLVFARQAGG